MLGHSCEAVKYHVPPALYMHMKAKTLQIIDVNKTSAKTETPISLQDRNYMISSQEQILKGNLNLKTCQQA